MIHLPSHSFQPGGQFNFSENQGLGKYSDLITVFSFRLPGIIKFQTVPVISNHRNQNHHKYDEQHESVVHDDLFYILKAN